MQNSNQNLSIKKTARNSQKGKEASNNGCLESEQTFVSSYFLMILLKSKYIRQNFQCISLPFLLYFPYANHDDQMSMAESNHQNSNEKVDAGNRDNCIENEDGVTMKTAMRLLMKVHKFLVNPP